jgi:hypothetical protein
MYYSKAHQNLSNELQNPEALTSPQNFLGPNYETVINFWWFIDGLTEDQWNEVARRYDAARGAARGAASDAARIAARIAARDAAGYAAWRAAWDAARDAAGDAARIAARIATYELIGMHSLLNDGKELAFVPLFDLTEEETKKETKEEPPLFYMTEIRPPTGEIFNMRMVRSPVVFGRTPTTSGINTWLSEYNHTFNE